MLFNFAAGAKTALNTASAITFTVKFQEEHPPSLARTVLALRYFMAIRTGTYIVPTERWYIERTADCRSGAVVEHRARVANALYWTGTEPRLNPEANPEAMPFGRCADCAMSPVCISNPRATPA